MGAVVFVEQKEGGEAAEPMQEEQRSICVNHTAGKR
jgi:hypothetical protein